MSYIIKTSYIAGYLQEEIQAEALVRSLLNFNLFLESAAFSHIELINFSNIARDQTSDYSKFR